MEWAYGSMRPLVAPQQKFIFSIRTLLSYKGFLRTKLWIWFYKNNPSSPPPLTSISKFVRKQGQCLSCNHPVQTFHDSLVCHGMISTKLPWGFLEGSSEDPSLVVCTCVGRTFCCSYTGCIVPKCSLAIEKELSILENEDHKFSDFPTSAQCWKSTLMVISTVAFSLEDCAYLCATGFQTTPSTRPPQFAPVLDPNMAKFHPLPTV